MFFSFWWKYMDSDVIGWTSSHYIKLCILLQFSTHSPLQGWHVGICDLPLLEPEQDRQLPESSFSVLVPSESRMDSELLLQPGVPNLLLLASEFCAAAQQNSNNKGYLFSLRQFWYICCDQRCSTFEENAYRNIQRQIYHNSQFLCLYWSVFS